MSRVLALVQLLGLSVAAGAMLAPGPRELAADWTGLTIYPWWTPLAVLAAAGAALACLLAPTGRRQTRMAAAGAAGVLAAHVGALGVWAHQHWLPAFGFGGSYAGEVGDLERLAVLVAAGGVVAALASIAQLVVAGAFPASAAPRAQRRRVVAGAAVLAGVPLVLAASDQFLRDVTSLGALLLVYGIPCGLSVAAAGWLTRPAVLGVVGASAALLLASAVHPSWQLAAKGAGPVFLVAAAALGGLLVVEVRDTRLLRPDPSTGADPDLLRH